MQTSNDFLKKHQGIVDSLCQRYYSTDPAIDQEDFRQSAALALLELYTKQPDAPTTTVFRTARQAVLKSIRQSSHLTEKQQRLIGLCSKNHTWLSTKLQREPLAADYAKFLGISETELSTALQVLAASTRISLSEEDEEEAYMEQND